MQKVDDQKFYRGSDRLLGGVCSGLAEGLHVNTLWVRLAFVLLTFLQGIGFVIYIVLWLVMPERVASGGSRSGFDSMTADMKRAWAELQGQFAASTATTAPPPPPPPPPPTAVTSSHTVPSPPAAPAAAAPPPPPVAASAPPAVPPAMTSTPPATTARRLSLIPGLILVLIGLVFLVSNVGLVDWSVFWPAALILVGVVLLVRNLERRP